MTTKMKKLKTVSVTNQRITNADRITNNFYLFKNCKFVIKIDLLKELIGIMRTTFGSFSKKF
jgi:hypothetical protein